MARATSKACSEMDGGVITFCKGQYNTLADRTNACVERVFSMMNDIWTTDKQFSIENVRNVLTLKYNQRDVSCTDLHTKLLSTPKLLKDINSSKKYDF